MELLVLLELDWRLRSLTPFAFIDLFACKADSSGRCSAEIRISACEVPASIQIKAPAVNRRRAITGKRYQTLPANQ